MDDGTLDELVSSSGQQINDEVRMAFRGETVSSCPALGFDVASAGKDKISKVLFRLNGLALGASDKPQKAIGRLFAWLAHVTQDDPDCDAFRDTVRKVILDF